MTVKTRPPEARFAEGPPLRQVGPNHVEWDGRRLLYFAGCDYFRFSWREAVRGTVVRAVHEDGLNVAASRLTTGNHPRYREVELAVAAFFGAPEALLLGTGYMTNLVVAQGLAEEITHAFADERAHVALRDAARFLDCPLTLFPHRDAAALARRLKRLPARASPLVMTDGMFARDGAVAPLREYLAVLPDRGWLLVDDAHGAGTLGAQGRGTPEHAGVSDSRIIQTVTFSKAFGAFGGAVLCGGEVRQRLAARSPMFGGSTPLPLPWVAAVGAAVELMQATGSKCRHRLRANAARFQAALVDEGVPSSNLRSSANPSPIFAFPPMPETAGAVWREKLLAAGVFPSFIRYPGGPAQGYFRFVLSSAHTPAHLTRLAGALAAVRGLD